VSLIILNEGALRLLQWTLGKQSPLSTVQKVGLFQNNFTPVGSNVYADFLQPSDPSLAGQVITPSVWQTPTIIAGQANTTYGAPTPFSFINLGPPITLYGYFVFDSSGPNALWAQNFAVARYLNTGDTLLETLNFVGATLP